MNDRIPVPLAPAAAPELEVGQCFRWNDGSPWPPADPNVAEILELKDGWVRYKIRGAPSSQDERGREADFRRHYSVRMPEVEK